MTKSFSIMVRILCFMFLQSLVFAVAGASIMQDLPGNAGDTVAAPDPQGLFASLIPLLLVTFIQGSALTLLVRRLPQSYLHRTGLVFVVIFTAGTVITQTESVLFLSDISTPLVKRIILLGVVTSLSAALLGSVLFRAEDRSPIRKAIPWAVWAVAMFAMGLAHVAIYFILGYWIIWIHPEARTFYGGGDLLGFWRHMQMVSDNAGYLYGVQLLRGLIWALMAGLLFRKTKGTRAQLAMVTGAVFIAFGTAPLLIPNPFMPEIVRYLHILETGLTAIIMAILAGSLFRSRPH